MTRCGCGRDAISYDGVEACCGQCTPSSPYQAFAGPEQALVDACKLPEIQMLVHKARQWGIVAEGEAKENYDTYLEVLAPFEQLLPEEES